MEINESQSPEKPKISNWRKKLIAASVGLAAISSSLAGVKMGIDQFNSGSDNGNSTSIESSFSEENRTILDEWRKMAIKKLSGEMPINEEESLLENGHISRGKVEWEIRDFYDNGGHVLSSTYPGYLKDQIIPEKKYKLPENISINKYIITDGIDVISRTSGEEIKTKYAYFFCDELLKDNILGINDEPVEKFDPNEICVVPINNVVNENETIHK